MIHNSSSDPVLIKKISLKIWSLRDEIEARIQNQMNEDATTPELLAIKVSELQSEYTKKSEEIKSNVLQLKSAEDLETSGDDDEMEKAMAAAIEGGKDSNEDANEEASDNAESPPTENSVSINGTSENDNNIISIATESAVKIPEEKISKAKAILSEIAMEKMFFFSNKVFTEGQSIVIQFCIPKTFIVNATVIYCRPFNIKSRIISANNYTHRMLITFNFLKEGERALLREFIKSIEPDITQIVNKSPNESSNSDDGDFDELDDLGL